LGCVTPRAAGTTTWTRTRGSSTPWWGRTRCWS
jgi:hypothetical protein